MDLGAADCQNPESLQLLAELGVARPAQEVWRWEVAPVELLVPVVWWLLRLP